MTADGYAGFNGLYEKARPGGPLTDSGCWGHVRRKIFDVHAATGSALVVEALARIGALYGMERDLYGKPPDARPRERQARAKPLAAALKAWAERSLTSCRVGPTWPRRCATCWRAGRPCIDTAARGLLVSFANGLSRDRAAIATALVESWSNGQTEGQIIRLKLMKLQMYGPAKLDLLGAQRISTR